MTSLEALHLHSDPLRAFERWYDEAAAAVKQPEAMALATVDDAGQPSVRMVLYKGLSAGGLCFYTNYESRKAADLAREPRAAVVFYWEPLHRQVRVEGRTEPLPPAESDAYFAARDRGSRVGAWASHQSAPVESRAVLEERMAAAEARFADKEVPRPPFWGGYRLLPTTFEFWQGRPSRLHDRFRFTRRDEGWHVQRLMP